MNSYESGVGIGMLPSPWMDQGWRDEEDGVVRVGVRGQGQRRQCDHGGQFVIHGWGCHAQERGVDLLSRGECALESVHIPPKHTHALTAFILC